MSLLDKLFPPDGHPGVGIFGRMFLKAADPPRERRMLLPPSGTGIGRKRKEDPAPYAPPIVRNHEPWPYQRPPGGGQRPYQPWPGGGDRGVR